MNVYSIDVRIYATAYIKADSEQEALFVARALNGDALHLPEHVDSDPPICGDKYDDPDLPDVSLSPVMTIHGPDDDAVVELVEELEDVEE